MGVIFGNSMDLMKRSMDYLWEKETVLTDNIANVDTPGYKARYVTFEEELAKKIQEAEGDGKQAIGEAIRSSDITLHKTENETSRMDGNSVNVDSQMVEMTRTALQYQYAERAFNGEANRLMAVIKG